MGAEPPCVAWMSSVTAVRCTADSRPGRGEADGVGVLDLLEGQQQTRGMVAERRLDRSAEAGSGRAREGTFVSEPRGQAIVRHARVPEKMQFRHHGADF